MPTYDYTCPECGPAVRTCSVDDRDHQCCECGAALARAGVPRGLHFRIPTHFMAGVTDADILPSSPESEKTWEECGVHRRGD